MKLANGIVIATKESKETQKKIKKARCLDCEERQVTLKWDLRKKIYTGNRICKVCKKLSKRKFFGAW